MRTILPTPHSLVSEGKFNFGTYKQEFVELNPLDADFCPIVPVPKFIKNLRLKEWEHFALVNPDYYVSLALFNAKTLGLAQVCLYMRKSRLIRFYERKTPSWKIVLPFSLTDDRAYFRSNGFQLNIHNAINKGCHEINFNIDETGELPAINGSFTCFEDINAVEPLVVSLPLSESAGLYSHKFVCPLKGSLRIDQQEVVFSQSDSYGLIDIHKGFYPYVMKWHWACGGGYDGKNRLLGFNLTDNQVKDQENYNENCIWIDNRLKLLPPVKFSFNKEKLLEPWEIKDSCGMVDLRFKPEVIRKVDVNALIIESRYRAPFGTFSGHLRTDGGQEISIRDFFGMCENFYLRT
jgi:hypothetical protein